MAEVTPFTSLLGTQQGRVTNPVGEVPPEGSNVFVLGFDLPLHTGIFKINDYVEVTQNATFAAGAKIFRVRARLRSPLVIPPWMKWAFTLSIDNVERTRRTLRAGALRDLHDLAANVTNIGGGAHLVALRLQLVTG